jgi:hypothetical protein
MELMLSGRTLPWTAAVRIRLPFYIAVPLSLLVGILVAITGVTILARSERTPYPLEDYSDLNSWQEVATRGFDCNERNTAPKRLICTFAPTSGPFSQIDLGVVNPEGGFIAFTVRERALTVGDLALWWGRPAIQSVGNTAMLTWRTYAASARLSRPNDGQFDYFLPLSMITIEREIIP